MKTSDTLEEVKKRAKERSFIEEWKHDLSSWIYTLKRMETFEKIYNMNVQERALYYEHLFKIFNIKETEGFEEKLMAALKSEVDKLNFIKRLLFVQAVGGLRVSDLENCAQNKDAKYASDNGLPLAAILANSGHGGRVIFQYDHNEGEDTNKLVNWIITGKVDGNIKESSYIYERSIDSHRLWYNEDGDLIDVDSAIYNAIESRMFKNPARHYGIDIGCVDSDNDQVKNRDENINEYAHLISLLDINERYIQSDGGHGHIYVQIIEAGLNKKGGMMIGLHSGAPGKSYYQYDFKGKGQATISPFGGRANLRENKDLLDDKSFAKANSGEIDSSLFPAKKGGHFIRINEENLNGIIKTYNNWEKKFTISLCAVLLSRMPFKDISVFKSAEKILISELVDFNKCNSIEKVDQLARKKLSGHLYEYSNTDIRQKLGEDITEYTDNSYRGKEDNRKSYKDIVMNI